MSRPQGAHVWDLRNPDGGSMGLDFARGRMAPADVVLAHAVPERVDVEIRTEDGSFVAGGSRLEHEAVTPMSRFRVDGESITRENVWPGPEDLGLPVILPGGEVGILQSWWNAGDHREWRWVVEFHNKL